MRAKQQALAASVFSPLHCAGHLQPCDLLRYIMPNPGDFPDALLYSDESQSALQRQNISSLKQGPECFREIPNRAGLRRPAGCQILQHMPGLCLLEGIGVEPSAADRCQERWLDQRRILGRSKDPRKCGERQGAIAIDAQASAPRRINPFPGFSPMPPTARR